MSMARCYVTAGRVFGGVRRLNVAASAVGDAPLHAQMPPCDFQPQPYTVRFLRVLDVLFIATKLLTL